MNENILTEKPNVKWDDISGLEGAKAALKEAILMPIRFKKMFNTFWAHDKVLNVLKSGYTKHTITLPMASRVLTENIKKSFRCSQDI